MYNPSSKSPLLLITHMILLKCRLSPAEGLKTS
nr:MAG TPA: hypothetical protein [Caudoviricetes sp.]